LAIVVVTTMIPEGLRVPSLRYVQFTYSLPDFINNLLLYVPLGFFLGGRRFVQATLAALALATTAETLQLSFVHRVPSPYDALTNTFGAIVGYLLARMWAAALGSFPPSLPIPKLLALAGIPAAVLGSWSLLRHPTRTDFSNWDRSFRVTLGNALTGNRSWKGTISHLAIYPQALNPEEVGWSTRGEQGNGGKIPTALSRNSPKTAALSSAPREEIASSFVVSGRASAAFGLLRNPRKTGPESRVPPEELAGSFPVWWHAAVPSALLIDRPEHLAGQSNWIAMPIATGQKVFASVVPAARLTIAVRLQTADLGQTGPAQIVSYSKDPRQTNFMLGQTGPTLTFRLRTPATGLNGTDQALASPPVLAANREQLVTLVYDGRMSTMFVDGKRVAVADLRSQRPHLPRQIRSILPAAVPVRELELIVSETVLSGLFTLGILCFNPALGRSTLRYLIGVLAGAVIGGGIWLWGVSAPWLGCQILLECIGASAAVASAVRYEALPGVK
jgi:VanZ like family